MAKRHGRFIALLLSVLMIVSQMSVVSFADTGTEPELTTGHYYVMEFTGNGGAYSCGVYYGQSLKLIDIYYKLGGKKYCDSLENVKVEGSNNDFIEYLMGDQNIKPKATGEGIISFYAVKSGYGDPIEYGSISVTVTSYHVWNFTSDGSDAAKGTLKCDCGESYALELLAPDNPVYDGSKHKTNTDKGVRLSVKDSQGSDAVLPDSVEATYVYNRDGEDYSTKQWYDAGEYNVTMKLNGVKSLSTSFKVDKKIIEPEVIENLEYNGKNHKLVSTDVEGMKFSTSKEGKYNTTAPSKKEVGEYKVYYKLPETETYKNYRENDNGYVTATIEQGSFKTPDLKDMTLYFNGQEQNLVDEESAVSEYGTFAYRLSDAVDRSFTTEIPTASGIGTYDIEYYVETPGNSNYKDSEVKRTTTTITYLEPKLATELVYDGSEQQLIANIDDMKIDELAAENINFRYTLYKNNQEIVSDQPLTSAGITQKDAGEYKIYIRAYNGNVEGKEYTLSSSITHVHNYVVSPDENTPGKGKITCSSSYTGCVFKDIDVEIKVEDANPAGPILYDGKAHAASVNVDEDALSSAGITYKTAYYKAGSPKVHSYKGAKSVGNYSAVVEFFDADGISIGTLTKDFEIHAHEWKLDKDANDSSKGTVSCTKNDVDSAAVEVVIPDITREDNRIIYDGKVHKAEFVNSDGKLADDFTYTTAYYKDSSEKVYSYKGAKQAGKYTVVVDIIDPNDKLIGELKKDFEIHEHSWKFEKLSDGVDGSDGVIAVKCDCGESYDVTLTPPSDGIKGDGTPINPTYDGNIHVADYSFDEGMPTEISVDKLVYYRSAEEDGEYKSYSNRGARKAGYYRADLTLVNSETSEEATVSVYFVIKAKDVTITSVKVKDKTYDGNTSAEIVSDSVVTAGMIDGDDVTLEGDITAEFKEKDVKHDKDGKVIARTVKLDYENAYLSGKDAENYKFNRIKSQEYNTSAFIYPKEVTITWPTKNELTYTGSVIEYNASIEDEVGSDALNVTYVSDSNKATDKGSYTAQIDVLVPGNDETLVNNYVMSNWETAKTHDWKIVESGGGSSGGGSGGGGSGGGGGSVSDPVADLVKMIEALDPNAATYAEDAQRVVDAYNALTADQKADQRLKEQTVASKLAAAEDAVKSEEQKKADQKKADEVAAMINKLPEVPSQASYDDAMAAYNAYMGLTDAQKTLLSPAAQEKVAAYAYYYESQYAAAQKVKSFKVKNVKIRKAKATWEKTAGISGYQLTYKAKGTKTKKVTLKASAVKKVVKKLKKGKKYTFRIRTFTKVYNPYTGSYEKVYGSWAKRTVKIKK